MRMSVQKTTLALTTLLSAILLSACEGADNFFKPINNEISIESFDSQYDHKARTDSIQRVTWTYTDGNVTLKTNDIVNANTYKGPKNVDLIILSEHFEGKQRKQNVDVSGNKIVFNILSDTTNQKEQTVVEMQAFNLSGISSSSYDSKTKKGVYTDLNHYIKIPSSVKFPEGSVCYVPKTSNSFEYFKFDINDESSYKSIKEWEDARIKDKNLVRTKSLKVGANNEYNASVAVYNSDVNDLNLLHAVVEYKGKVYNADLSKKGTKSNNVNALKDNGVDCTSVNKVAADFLQDQIVQHYR